MKLKPLHKQKHESILYQNYMITTSPAQVTVCDCLINYILKEENHNY